MGPLKPGKPSSFAEKAVKSGARWPQVPLSSDNDVGGGVSLHVGGDQSPDQPVVKAEVAGSGVKSPSTPSSEHSKLSATSKPFVPSTDSDDGAQKHITDQLIDMYCERQRRATDATITGQSQSGTAFAGQGYIAGAAPPYGNGDRYAQHGFGQNQQGTPKGNRRGTHGSYGDATQNPPFPNAPITRSYGGVPMVPKGYRAGLPGSASDGNMPKISPVVAYSQSTLYPGVLAPLQFHHVPREIRNQRSEMLNSLAGKGAPSGRDLLNPYFVPFVDIYDNATAADWGVIRIKNIPFGTTRAEVVAMVGRNSKMLNDTLEPVHIIMERVTSKTMDAFVEFSGFEDAVQAVDKFQRNANHGRVGRIGNRHVDVELSSQAQLMKALFPVARGVVWSGERPRIERGSQFPWENFKSFFTQEEMTMLCKHVEFPQRSSYARDCPERPYECMISTLKKIPWYMAEHITIKQRYAVYESCYKMITTLQSTIGRFPDHERLTTQLLNRLVKAAMLCQGFTVQQKDNIALLAKLDDNGHQFNQPRFADLWCHLYTLGPKPGIPLDVLEYYIAVIREETKRAVDSLNIGQKIAFQNQAASTNGYFGYLWAELDFPTGAVFDNMTLAEVNRRELQAIDRILRRAVDGGVIPASYTKTKTTSTGNDTYGLI